MNEKHILPHQSLDEILMLPNKIAEEQLKTYMFLISISDGLTYIRNHSENKEPYTINIFERYNSDEPTTSWAMAEILKFKNGGMYPLIKSFIEKFLIPIGLKSEWIDNPIITTEKDRIDICIKDKKYAIIFENKVKGACYQPNQIARYIHKLNNLLEKHYDNNIFLVLMPNFHDDDYIEKIPKSTWRLLADYYKSKSEQKCVTKHDLCWCDYNHNNWEKQWDTEFCKSCIKTFKKKYQQHTIVLQRELTEWLINDCIKLIPHKETILKSFIIQFADFLNLQYETRENQKLKREMKQYLKEKLFNKDKSNIDNWNEIDDKLNEIKKLEKEIGYLLESISCDVIDDWYNELLPKWGRYGLKNERYDHFGIRIQGVWIGCWNGKNEDNHKQYWGFYSRTEFTIKQQKMIEAILDETNTDDYEIENNNLWYWQYTCNGAEKCNSFYNAAIELGYLEKQEA